jgi:hypothetical protein
MRVNSLKRTCGIVLYSLLAITGCTRARESAPAKSFSFEQQLGIVMLQGEEGGCLAIYNPSIKPGARVVLVDQPDRTQLSAMPNVSEASVVERLPSRCESGIDHIGSGDREGAGFSFYQIRRSVKSGLESGFVVAVVDPVGPIELRDGKIDADLDRDGTKESFRTCASAEGVHHQVWTGVPLQGKPRWHWYIYAGYDTEPTCTEQEYFGPKQK